MKAVSLQTTEQFQTQYQPFGATLAMVNLADLITPQWWVDSAYVEALAADAPSDDDPEGLFQFSFASGQLAQPMLMGVNGVAFASGRKDLGGPTPLRVVQYSPEKVTFQFDVIPRPNWILVATPTDLNRPLILNGVHHLLALLRAGHNQALCLSCQLGSITETYQLTGINLQDPGVFKPDMLTSSRPPLLRDYLDNTITTTLNVRAVDQYLRLILQPDMGVIPRGA
jgi:hypothetical protein